MVARGPLTVVLYARPDCHLCAEAEQLLARIARRIPLTVQVIDIDSDDYLQQRYLLEIPVVCIGDVELARAPISEWRLEDAIEAFASGR